MNQKLKHLLGKTIQPSFVIKDRDRLPWDRAQTEERGKLLTGWQVVIAEAGDHSKVESMIRQHGEQVLDDVFAKKKNGTLQVRLRAMMLYVRWARAKGLNPFPLSEDQRYAYVDQLRRDGAPATRASSFRSALAFCKGAIQLLGVDEVVQSGRIAGSAHKSYVTKRTLRQRDALTVHQVSMFQLEGVYFTVFHACVRGGTRDKQTALLRNCEELCQL